MNRNILRLALPNIITNITVPLLGIVDMAIVGHLSSTHIGAITIGTSIFNLIYWNFGFLRMGTSGFTAQAFGERNFTEAVRIFVRAFAIALLIALLLLVFQRPLGRFACWILNSSGDIMRLALIYFSVRIWAAPATLGLYAIKGWFIGMQNSKAPMWIAIFINVVNILCSLLFVLVFGWDIKGVALGTVLAQYSGVVLGFVIGVKKYGQLFREHLDIRNSLHLRQMARFFKVNGDIFLRTVCLCAVFTFITSASAKISDEILEIDALLLQFFTLFSYIMDGFAYAGEALVGRYIGERNKPLLKKSVRYLLMWGLLLTGVFTGLYAAFGDLFLRIFTSEAELIAGVQDYLFWILLVPVCGFAAFLFDGIFVGATASRTMRNAMFVATLAFFGVYYGLPNVIYVAPDDIALKNNVLWIAFMVYLVLRGVLQGVFVRKSVYGKVSSELGERSSELVEN